MIVDVAVAHYETDAEAAAHETDVVVVAAVLVADNATIHSGGVNSDLEQWLWDNFQVFLLWLPARTPEWNPIELVWNILVARLGTYSLEVARSIPGSHSLVVAADIILRGITHEEVQACYEKSGYMCGYV